MKNLGNQIIRVNYYKDLRILTMKSAGHYSLGLLQAPLRSLYFDSITGMAQGELFFNDRHVKTHSLHLF